MDKKIKIRIEIGIISAPKLEQFPAFSPKPLLRVAQHIIVLSLTKSHSERSRKTEIQ